MEQTQTNNSAPVISLAPPSPQLKQTGYHAASQVCGELNTVVPVSMQFEQKKFNERLKTFGDVDKFVMDRLHYTGKSGVCKLSGDAEPKFHTDYEIFCDSFFKEQVDAIATAIWNFENTGNGIILADQTGVGKGRVAAGLMRYAVLHLGKQPIFMTEKKHLINDIYRDLIGIHFDAGVPFMIKHTTIVQPKEYTDEEIEKMVDRDIDEGELRFDVQLPEGEDGEEFDLKLLHDEEYEDAYEIVVDGYRSALSMEFEEVYHTINANYEAEVKAKLATGIYHKVRPLLTNGETFDVMDKDGNIVYKHEKKNIEEVIKDPRKPLSQQYSCVCLAYSQVNKIVDAKGKMQPKVAFLRKHANDNILILDEAHNAAGGRKGKDGKRSNTGENVRAMLEVARDAVYVSATYAKRAENMPLYVFKTSVREAKIGEDMMIRVFNKGGNALQEATAAELVRLGQLLRREKRLDGDTQYFYEDAASNDGLNQIAKLNRVAKSFKKVNALSQTVRKSLRDALMARFPSDKEKRKEFKFGGETKRFAFLLFNFFILGLKVQQVVREAIKQMDAGRKPIIAIANTLESAFDNLKKDFFKEIPFELGDMVPNDFSLYVAYLCNYTLRINRDGVTVDDKGKEQPVKKKIYLKDPKGEFDEDEKFIIDTVWGAVSDEYQETLTAVLQEIIGTSISPIDAIKHQIAQQSGGKYSVEEVTGRGRCLKFTGEHHAEGELQRRVKRKPQDIIRDYNENKIDCLIINQSGATGVSMHAIPNKVAHIVYDKIINPENPKRYNENGELVDNLIDNPPKSLDNKAEVKQRVMLVCQMELDINKEVQKLGRINRTGQVYAPMYRYLISVIPSESRLSALMEKKLRSLMSITAANEEQGKDLFTSDDFFSKDAIEPFNETMNIMRTGVEASKKEDIYDYTKTMYFVEYDTQLDFYKTFQEKLGAHIKALKEQGNYTGSMQIKEYKADVIKKVPFYIGSDNAYSGFGGHGWAEVSNCKIYKQKTLEYDIAEKILVYLTDDKGGQGDVKAFRTVEDYQKYWQERTTQRLEKLVEDDEKERKKSAEEIEKLQAAIKEAERVSNLEQFLTKVVELQNESVEVNRKIGELTPQVAEKMLAGDMDGANLVLKQIQELKTRTEGIEAELNAPEIKEAIDRKDEIRQALGKIRKFTNEIESWERILVRHLKNSEEQRKAIQHFVYYLGNLGQIFQVQEFSEEKVGDTWRFDEEVKEYGEDYRYMSLSDSHAVLVGVNFDGYMYDDFTLGRIDLRFARPTDLLQKTVNQFHAEFKASDIKFGRQHTVKHGQPEGFYKGKWNEIVGKIDNSHVEERVILSGSLLKMYNAISTIMNGAIIKYDTKEGAVRVGLEITKKEEYDSLKKRIDTVFDTYLDVSKDNFQRIILQHFNDLKNEEKPQDRYSYYGRSDFKASRGILNELVIPSASAKTKIFLRTYQSETSGEMMVGLYSTGLKECEYFMQYVIAGNIPYDYVYYDRPAASKIAGRQIDIYDDFQGYSSYFDMNKTIFCNGDESKYQFTNKSGFRPSFGIRFKLDDFYKFLDELDKNYDGVVSVISSDVFAKYQDTFKLVQFVDDEEKEPASAVVVRTADEIINELVELLKTL